MGRGDCAWTYADGWCDDGCEKWARSVKRIEEPVKDLHAKLGKPTKTAVHMRMMEDTERPAVQQSRGYVHRRRALRRRAPRGPLPH